MDSAQDTAKKGGNKLSDIAGKSAKAIGAAAIGPVSTERGTLLRPANFYGIHDVPIVRAIEEDTGYPVFFIPYP